MLFFKYDKQLCVSYWLNKLSLFPPGKKARTFDLDAIFEQTRRTAIERSQRILGRYTNVMSSLLVILSPGCVCVTVL